MYVEVVMCLAWRNQWARLTNGGRWLVHSELSSREDVLNLVTDAEITWSRIRHGFVTLVFIIKAQGVRYWRYRIPG